MTNKRGQAPSLPARGQFSAPAGETLAAALRNELAGCAWTQVRRLCASGKVSVDEQVVTDPAWRLRGGERVTWDLARRDPGRAPRADFRIVFEDGQLLVVDKPEGISSVPYERKDVGTALDLVRAVWRSQGRPATQQPLYVVHRIDKDTSGLLAFAKTKLAERGLHRIFKQHLAARMYIAVAHGHVRPGRIESRLVADRGDGLRGSTRHADQGQHAVTHVEVAAELRDATVCRVRLETGRTHQIRIHLAERGHPLVGETVYIRDLRRAGKRELSSSRLLLHAATLGFAHPVTGAPLSFSSPLPPDYVKVLTALGGKPPLIDAG